MTNMNETQHSVRNSLLEVISRLKQLYIENQNLKVLVEQHWPEGKVAWNKELQETNRNAAISRLIDELFHPFLDALQPSTSPARLDTILSHLLEAIREIDQQLRGID